MLNILNITSTQHQLLTELISGTPNDDFLLNTSKTLFRLHRVLLDFYKYILSCAIKFVTYLFGHPRGTSVFSKLQGLQNYFPKTFRCNLSFYECGNFSNSYLNHIFESEDFRALLKNSIIWGVKCGKLSFRKSWVIYQISFENCT